ncbi:MAG: type II toxin-antitoxin system Phd/YefM family antitoxin [Nitrospirae bacterium]|nr:type II toxin-antitoxin system Phd/YefM family antitoxin [Nitrospirota bacterium]
MKTIKSTDIQRKFGLHLESALIEPIVIERNGRAAAAMISIKYLEQLQELEDRYWADKALEAQKSGYVDHEKAQEALILR